jgi:hypothetical protein
MQFPSKALHGIQSPSLQLIINESDNQLNLFAYSRRRNFHTVISTVTKQLKAKYAMRHATVHAFLGMRSVGAPTSDVI